MIPFTVKSVTFDFYRRSCFVGHLGFKSVSGSIKFRCNAQALVGSSVGNQIDDHFMADLCLRIDVPLPDRAMRCQNWK